MFSDLQNIQDKLYLDWHWKLFLTLVLTFLKKTKDHKDKPFLFFQLH